MNKIAAYERALVELETEKLAEQVYETYAIDGYLPPGYAEVFMAMHKEANAATETIGATGKLRNWVIGKGAKLHGYGKEMAAQGAKNLGGATPGLTGELQNVGGRLLQRAGTTMVENPYLSTAGAGLGTAALGYGGYRMLRGKPNPYPQM